VRRNNRDTESHRAIIALQSYASSMKAVISQLDVM
jgi:hypothetical protein